MATKKAKKEIAHGNFSIELRCAEKNYNTVGESFLECLSQITEVAPIKGFALIKAKMGERESEMRLFPIQLKRLLMNKNYKLILSKQLTLKLS